MVKKKGKSKRTSFKDKYKIQRKVAETHRKRKKQAKRDAANGIVRHSHKSKKDPGIPNSWPFKQDLLQEIQRTREKQQEQQKQNKDQRKDELRKLREHQEAGGTARTIEELVQQASQAQAAFASSSASQSDHHNTNSKDTSSSSGGSNVDGQQSRRAYLRELKKVVDTADVILQVLDARDPHQRMHPKVENQILSDPDKRMVLVLNKIDLVPKPNVQAWLQYLRRSHPTIALQASKKSSSHTENTDHDDLGMDGLLQLVKNYARTGGTGGKHKTTIVVGIVGYPNVGKSSIINALKRTRSVGVSARPGFTKSMQEVVLDKTVRLLDSPGVVFDDKKAGLGNCVEPDAMDDPIAPIAELLERCQHQSLLLTYNIPNFPQGDVMTFLALIAKSYGRVLKGGIPDKFAAARAVLKDWNTGKIPFFTAPPNMESTAVSDSAMIVESFGKEFDLAKFDESVLGSLKDDKDEVDFVKLEGPSERQMDDDDDDEMEEESSEDGGGGGGGGSPAAMARARLANAEDYDFDDL